jgi:hypothetical protein
MRLAFAGLTAAATLASAAVAQTPPPAPAAPATAPAPAAAPTVPGTTAPGDAAPAAPAAPEAPATPPPPPAPPTDPAAIALLNTLENVCVPSAAHGDKDIGKAAKAAGYRKSGDNWVYRQPTFQFTLLAPGSNPSVCQVELTHPVDLAEPAKPLVVALHDWATFGHGWSLVSNYKHTESGEQFITRSWEHSADGMNEALVLTTTRKGDGEGAPEGRNADTSTMMYTITKATS